jgi:hypothetical protein
MALENIQHRLAAVYGESAILTNGMENQLYVVRLQFPDGS